MRDTQQFVRGQIYWRKSERFESTEAGIIGKERPVLIVSNNVGLACSNVATVVPLTTAERRNSLCTQVNITLNGKDNYILCEQIYTCNLSELHRYVSTLNEHRMKEVEEALMYTLGLKPLPENKYKETLEANDDSSDTSTDVTAELTKERTDNVVTNAEHKLRLIEDYNRYKRNELCLTDLMKMYPYRNLGSLQAAIRRYRKQLGVQ